MKNPGKQWKLAKITIAENREIWPFRKRKTPHSSFKGLRSSEWLDGHQMGWLFTPQSFPLDMLLHTKKPNC